MEPAPPPPHPTGFGTTCTCGEIQAGGVSHHIGEPCIVDATGEVFVPSEAVPSVELVVPVPTEDAADGVDGEPADEEPLSMPLNDG